MCVYICTRYIWPTLVHLSVAGMAAAFLTVVYCVDHLFCFITIADELGAESGGAVGHRRARLSVRPTLLWREQ